jgi:membrane protein implicated in regulation of membrane protease activity
MMVVLFAATGVVVGAVVALTLQSWWVLGAVLLVHFLATVTVVGYAIRRAGESYDKPDPVAEARIEERQVASRRQVRAFGRARGERDTGST